MKHTPLNKWICECGGLLQEGKIYKEFNGVGAEVDCMKCMNCGEITFTQKQCSRLEQVRSTTQLVAAAPELYEACKEFVRKCENGEARSKRSYAQMKAAIAKAEGKS